MSPAITNALLKLKASDFTAGKTSIATELAFKPPSDGQVMVPVTKAMYGQLFSLAKSLGLKSSDL